MNFNSVFIAFLPRCGVEPCAAFPKLSILFPFFVSPSSFKLDKSTQSILQRAVAWSQTALSAVPPQRLEKFLKGGKQNSTSVIPFSA